MVTYEYTLDARNSGGAGEVVPEDNDNDTNIVTRWNMIAFLIKGAKETTRYHVLWSITNKMQRYTVLFIAVNAVHVSGDIPAQNMYRFDSNKEYCITLHLVGYT